jgi:glutamate-1-semialdehyde 2,1-aminomutase
MKRSRSIELFEESKKYIPGGVNSPVRAFANTEITPPFIKSGKGSHIFDEDGNEYVDYIGAWGPLIFGHCFKEINESIAEALSKGTGFGAPTEYELEMAKLICEAVPSVEMVRMVNSGTEATMSAIRLARGYTGRNYIVKFEGNYHGHSDSLLVKAGSGALTHGAPDSPGVTRDVARYTLTARYNDIQSVNEIFRSIGNQIAAVIVEPVAGNMGVVPAKAEFMRELRAVTKKHGALLIIDEVMTGFRVAYGGAQSLYNVDPDITCFGKIIGGGLPVGAYGGKREIMRMISPSGPIYQAGTLSGNPIAMSAGICALKILRDNPNVYQYIDRLAEKLEKGLREVSDKYGITCTINRVGSMMTMFFTDKPVVDFNTVTKSDTQKYVKFFTELLNQGVYISPSQYEAMFISYAHTEADIEKTILAADYAMRKL